MEDFALLSPLLLVIAGLMIGAILKSILKKTGLPYTVGLFVFGIIIGLLNRFNLLDMFPKVSTALNSIASIEPDFILYVFLPILIFGAAYEMNLHIFRKTLANATLLAVPGLIISMFLTACMIIGISLFSSDYSQWTWTLALMFGALISATDPVAVVALLHELGTSKRFSTLVDGESLLNDGTGIVCFMLFFGAYTTTENINTSPFLQFIQVVAGGAILGFVLARIAIWFITRINSEEMIQNSVIILSAYITFIISQYYMGVSGVIALVVFGLTVAYVGKPRLRPDVNFFMEKFWDLLSYIANTLIFIMVGIIIAEKVAPGWNDILILLIIYIGLNIIRFIMIMLLYPAMKRIGYGLSKRESAILTWGGLRGALAMVLALMVSYAPGIPDDIQRQILFITAGIVTLTLSINATTTQWFLERLGLTNIPTARSLMKYRIYEHIHNESEKYYEKLHSRESLQNSNWDKVMKFMPEKPEKQAPVAQDKDFMAEIRLRILDKEKANCRKFYDDGILSKSSFLHIMNSLDELYDHDGKYPLNIRNSIFNFCDRSFLYSYADKMPEALQNWISFYFKERIMISHDMGKGFILIQKESIKVINELQSSDLIEDKQKILLDKLKIEVEDNINKMNILIEKLSESFPKAYRYALTQKAIRMLLNNEKQTIKHLLNEGIISEKDAGILTESVNEKFDEVNSFSHTIPATIIRWILGMRKE